MERMAFWPKHLRYIMLLPSPCNAVRVDDIYDFVLTYVMTITRELMFK